MSFFVQCALIFASIPYFLTIPKKYLLNHFGISISSSIILLLSINLIVILALTLFEKRCLTICQNFLLSYIKFISRFISTFLSYNSKIISKSRMWCSYFVINLLWYALRSFCLIGLCLFKISVKRLRKCWYSILFISRFNILLSR